MWPSYGNGWELICEIALLPQCLVTERFQCCDVHECQTDLRHHQAREHLTELTQCKWSVPESFYHRAMWAVTMASGLEMKLNVANGYLDIRMKWDFMITANNHSEWKHYFECNVVNVIKLQGYYYIFMNAPNVIMEMMVKHGFVALSYMEIFSWLL